MAFFSYTYTFANSSTADANQVNTNFQDVLDATSDGTIDFNINALTVAGSCALNGAVTLGNGSPDDIIILGSLAGSIPIKANSTYGIGAATLGLSGIYFGGTSTFTTRIIGVATASYTITLPATVGLINQVLENTDGAGVLNWASRDSADFFCNLSLTATVSGSALTVALKDASGSNASASSPVKIAFRNATLTTGTYSLVSVTGALSVVASSGSTLGHVSAVPDYVYVYAINNAGTAELALSSVKFDEGGVFSTTTEGGAGAADTRTVLYSTTARTNVAIRLIGRLLSTQAAAGTWATAIAEISTGSRFVEPAMNDIHATKMGFKGYVHGTTYNGGNAPTISLSSGGGSLASITYSRFMPKQMQDGSWTLSGNFRAVLTPVGRTSAVFALAGGFNFSNEGAITLTENDTPANVTAMYASTSNTLVCNHQSASTTTYLCSFSDLPITAKPNWAY